MTVVLDKIEFLSRSPHRIRIFDTLVKPSCDQPESKQVTEALSQGRILGGFADWGWVTRVDHRYETTPLDELGKKVFIRLPHYRGNRTTLRGSEIEAERGNQTGIYRRTFGRRGDDNR